MVDELHAVVIGIQSDLKHIKENTDEIKSAVFGNGHRGLKTRMTIVEITLGGVVAVAGFALYCIIRSALG